MREQHLSIATSFDNDVPIDVQLEAIAAASFTHFSIGAKEEHSGYLTIAGRRRLRRLAQMHRRSLDTIHGPRADRPESAS